MQFKKYKFTDIVKTELGEMTIQKYLDICFYAFIKHLFCY